MPTAAGVSAGLSSFLDQAPVAMALIAPDGRYRAVNATYARLLQEAGIRAND